MDALKRSMKHGLLGAMTILGGALGTGLLVRSIVLDVLTRTSAQARSALAVDSGRSEFATASRTSLNLPEQGPPANQGCQGDQGSQEDAGEDVATFITGEPLKAWLHDGRNGAPQLPVTFTVGGPGAITIDTDITEPGFSAGSSTSIGRELTAFGTMTIEGVLDLMMLVKAGSMTRADSSRPSPSDPAIVSLNLLRFDEIPTPMPDGAAPPSAGTLQPAGATFAPPAAIMFPNMTGLAPGSVTYFFSFNHDTGRFEIPVTADGQSMISDAGSGIAKSGWGGFCPPSPFSAIFQDFCSNDRTCPALYNQVFQQSTDQLETMAGYPSRWGILSDGWHIFNAWSWRTLSKEFEEFRHGKRRNDLVNMLFADGHVDTVECGRDHEVLGELQLAVTAILAASSPGGLVLDRSVLPFHPATPVAAGWNLFAICAADHLLRSDALAIASHTAGLIPTRNIRRHWWHWVAPNVSAPTAGWNEYSIIDCAIFVHGALWAQNHFIDDPDILSLPSDLHQDFAGNVSFVAHSRGASVLAGYVETDSMPDISKYQGNKSWSSWWPLTPSANTTYYWRVAAVQRWGITTGQAWSLATTTLRPEARSSSPASRFTGDSMSMVLDWAPASRDTSYDVYFDSTQDSGNYQSDLHWDGNSKNENGYRIVQLQEGVNCAHWDSVAPTSSSNNTCICPQNLQSNRHYSFAVRARNGTSSGELNAGSPLQNGSRCASQVISVARGRLSILFAKVLCAALAFYLLIAMVGNYRFVRHVVADEIAFPIDLLDSAWPTRSSSSLRSPTHEARTALCPPGTQVMSLSAAYSIIVIRNRGRRVRRRNADPDYLSIVAQVVNCCDVERNSGDANDQNALRTSNAAAHFARVRRESLARSGESPRSPHVRGATGGD